MKCRYLYNGEMLSSGKPLNSWISHETKRASHFNIPRPRGIFWIKQRRQNGLPEKQLIQLDSVLISTETINATTWNLDVEACNIACLIKYTYNHRQYSLFNYLKSTIYLSWLTRWKHSGATTWLPGLCTDFSVIGSNLAQLWKIFSRHYHLRKVPTFN